MNTEYENGQGSAGSAGETLEEMNHGTVERQSLPEEGDNPNFLREKTFTPELKTLIDQVTHHEPEKSDEEETDSEEEIIRRLHRLFYRSINLVNIDKINKSFNPYGLGTVSGDETIIRHIHAVMIKAGLPHYTLMPYHVGKRCFLPTVNHVRELDIHNIYIDPNDALYGMVMGNTEGIILSGDIIDFDPLLKKRFTPSSALEEHIYYLSSLKKIHADLYAELHTGGDDHVEDGDLSPLILIEIQNGAASFDASGIYRKLKNGLGVFSLFYTCMQYQKIRRTELKGYKQYFSSMEYHFRLAARNKNTRCYALRFKKYYSRGTQSLKSYFMAMVNKKLSGKSLIIDPDHGRLLILCDTIDTAFMEKTIYEWSNLLNGEFTYEVCEDPGKMGFSGFLKNVIFK